MLQKRHGTSHVDGETGDRGHVVDNVILITIEPHSDSVSITHLWVTILHAEQKLLQLLQQKGEHSLRPHSRKPAHELLKIQLCRLCTVCVQHHHNARRL